MKKILAYLGAIGFLLLPFMAACQCLPDYTLTVAAYDTLPANNQSNYANCLASCVSGGNSSLIDIPDTAVRMDIYCPDTTFAQITLIDSCRFVLLDTCILLDGDATMGMGNYLTIRTHGEAKALHVRWQAGKTVVISTNEFAIPLWQRLIDLDTVCATSITRPIQQQEDSRIIDVITGQEVTELQHGRVYYRNKKKFVIF